MKENSWTIICTVRESTPGLIRRLTMESGLITKCMGLGHSICPTGNTIRAIMKMIKNKVTESSSGPVNLASLLSGVAPPFPPTPTPLPNLTIFIDGKIYKG